MSNQIPTTPIITFYEYKYCYFAIHRMLSKFFKRDWSKPGLTINDVNAAILFLKRANFDYNMKNKIAEIIQNLYYSKNFTLDCIKYYTKENLCYIFNKTLRDIGKNFDGMSHFIGPFNYALYKFLRDYPSKGIYCNKILYRDLNMSLFDLMSYYLSVNDVICFPSFTSTTTLKNLNFQATKNAKIINNTSKNDFPVKMIFYYRYRNGDISPGVSIRNESYISTEEEVILFPFTFVRINKIEMTAQRKVIIHLDIINRNKIIEFEFQKGCRIDLDQKNNRLIIQ